jgi:hypothetical protein
MRSRHKEREIEREADSEGETRVKDALFKEFCEFRSDKRSILIAGITERLAAHGIDPENVEIMISGRLSDFIITVHGGEYHGRLGRNFESDLKFLWTGSRIGWP